MLDIVFFYIREDNNVIYKSGCESFIGPEKIVYIPLDVGKWVSKTYNSDIESLLATIANDSEAVPIIRVDYKLIEKRAGINNR